MKTTFACIVISLILMASCTSKKAKSIDPTGVYTREYSFIVKNLETDKDIGMRTIRDTILIREVGDRYEVSNRKWMMNDYDQEGWRNMEHADDRPFLTYIAELNTSQPELSAGGHDQIYFSDGTQYLSLDVGSKVKYERVR